MLKASSSTVGWFLTVDQLIGPILGFLILVVFPFLVIRSISRENKAAEMRRAVSEEVAKRLSEIADNSPSHSDTTEPQVFGTAPESRNPKPTQEEKLRKQLEAQKLAYETQIERLETAHLQELENLDESHERALSSSVKRATNELLKSLSADQEEETKKLELKEREQNRKAKALAAKYLSSQGLPSWDSYSSTMEFLGGHPKFPFLTREISLSVLSLSSRSDISNYKGIIELCHHLAGLFLSSDEISSQDKLHFLTSCRWLPTSPQKLNVAILDGLGKLSEASDQEFRVIEAFSTNFAQAAQVSITAANQAKLREYSTCVNCGSRIEQGRTRCREACGYS